MSCVTTAVGSGPSVKLSTGDTVTVVVPVTGVVPAGPLGAAVTVTAVGVTGEGPFEHPAFGHQPAPRRFAHRGTADRR